MTSCLEYMFDLMLQDAGIEGYKREFRFHPIRRWRFDFAWVDAMVAVEIQGGTYMNGRHNRGAAMEKEYEKLNEAAVLGWRVLFASAKTVGDGSAVEYVKYALGIPPLGPPASGGKEFLQDE